MKRWHWLFLAVFVFLLRLPYFNSPTIHIDEQFYLVVADKWVNQGLIPYVDVWDRKPIGIFAIYAVAVALFKNAILGYQILAALFVIATCGVVFHIALMIDDRRTSFFSAMIYGVGVMLWEGQGGQTPIFYNLFVACAIAIFFEIIAAEQFRRRDVVTRVLTASLLFGVSLQVKYTCVIEASVLSLYVLYILYARRDFKLHELIVLAIGMMLCGLFPTAFVGATFASLGHWHEFFQANFVSIFEKHTWNLTAREYLWRFTRTSLFGICFLPLAAFAFWKILFTRIERVKARLLYGVVIWILAAFVGALLFGNPTQHYFLPTVMPLALLVSVGFLWLGQERSRLGYRTSALQKSLRGYGGQLAVLSLPIVASFVLSYTNPLGRGEEEDIYAVGAYLKEHRNEGCVFVFNRLPILYYLGNACAPSIYVFPNHLSEISEVRAPGGKRLTELARVLASTPSMIFVRRPHTTDTDITAEDMLEQVLHDRYALVMERPGHGQLYQVYEPVRRPHDQPGHP